MRMRPKSWAEPELSACPILIEEPKERRGRWREEFADAGKPLHLELGCGKCVQCAAAAQAMPEVNYLAIDEVRLILAVGARVIREAYEENVPENLRIACADASCIREWISPEDGVERVYIAFCNPWTQRKKHHKRRLTHPRQLMQYREFLPEGGEIWFKTDDRELFDASQEYFARCGFAVTFYTEDLHASGFAPNFVSEHEARFTAEGLPTYFCIARKEAMSAEETAAVLHEYRMDRHDQEELP